MNKQIILFGVIATIMVFTIYAFEHRKNIATEQKFLNQEEVDQLELSKMWQKYQRDFRMHFDDSDEEEQFRFSVFTKNIKSIQGKAGLSITQYMHLTEEEFAEQTFGVEEKETGSYQQFQTLSVPLQSIDWQTTGVVSPVKTQGMCASSWAFSVTAGVESALFQKNKTLPSISEQNLLDCDEENGACNGGDREKALAYIIEKGLTSQSTNPYKAYKAKCKYSDKQEYSISSYKTITNCNDLMVALQSGPVVVAIDGQDLQFYKEGILSTSYQSRNYGALLVGYDSEQGYWKIKSSLGLKFGEKGYVRLSASIKDGMIENSSGICDKAFQIFA